MIQKHTRIVAIKCMLLPDLSKVRIEGRVDSALSESLDCEIFRCELSHGFDAIPSLASATRKLGRLREILSFASYPRSEVLTSSPGN